MFFWTFCALGSCDHEKSTHKGVNWCSNYITQIQHQRPKWPTVTLTWHACKHKGHTVTTVSDVGWDSPGPGMHVHTVTTVYDVGWDSPGPGLHATTRHMPLPWFLTLVGTPQDLGIHVNKGYIPLPRP